MLSRTRLFTALLLVAPALAFAGPSSIFPVHRAPDGRTLRDVNEHPFPILGRTAWFITSLTQGDFRFFLDDSAAKGYTAIEFHVINHDPRGNNEPRAGNGAIPFTHRLNGAAWDGSLNYADIGTGAPDLTRPNEAYWAHADAILAYADSHNILAFMFPAYVGWAGGEQGWMRELVANGPARCHAYGAWIAARYASRGNIVWMMGGDMSSFTPEQAAVEQALLDGLNSIPNQLSTFFSAEWSSDQIATDQPQFGHAMSLNGAYSFSGYTAYQCRRGYAYQPVEPAFLLEEPYDEEGPDGNSVNPSATQPVRRFQWWGWLSCTEGYIAGNGYIWPFNPGWRNHVNTQGARDMARLNTFIKSVRWDTLAPSGLGNPREIVLAGGSQPQQSDYVAAAITRDHSMIVAYIPPDHAGPITIDMTRLKYPSRARWFNPTSGAYTLIAPAIPNNAPAVFNPPGDNGTGFDDWVLVLDVVFSHGTRPSR